MKNCGEVLENVDLKKYTSIKIGGICRYLVKPDSSSNFQNLIRYLNLNKLKYYIIGAGTNVILDDNFFDGVVIATERLNKITYDDNIVTVGAGVKIPYLVQNTLEKGYTSLAFACNIPGNVGGSVCGNAGAYGHEIMEFVKDVTVMDENGNISILKKDDISFGYRYTSLKNKYIILSVRFILTKGNLEETLKEVKDNTLRRISTQPLEKPNVGSIFRNPEGNHAAKLIEDAMLKGKIVGGAKVSEKHANFIVNENNASFNDVVNLITLIKRKVKDEYNVELVLEPNIVRWNEI